MPNNNPPDCTTIHNILPVVVSMVVVSAVVVSSVVVSGVTAVVVVFMLLESEIND